MTGVAQILQMRQQLLDAANKQEWWRISAINRRISDAFSLYQQGKPEPHGELHNAWLALRKAHTETHRLLSEEVSRLDGIVQDRRANDEGRRAYALYED